MEKMARIDSSRAMSNDGIRDAIWRMIMEGRIFDQSAGGGVQKKIVSDVIPVLV